MKYFQKTPCAYIDIRECCNICGKINGCDGTQINIYKLKTIYILLQLKIVTLCEACFAKLTVPGDEIMSETEAKLYILK